MVEACVPRLAKSCLIRRRQSELLVSLRFCSMWLLDGPILLRLWLLVSRRGGLHCRLSLDW
jgi:hypothetical protein